MRNETMFDLSAIVSRRGAALALLGTFAFAGCASWSNTEKGAAGGAAAGGVIGAVIGESAGSTAKGAILGAVIGGAAGAVIGHQMDKQAEELAEELENAEVERVGEGIQVTFDSGILFDFDSSNLRPEARSNLRELASSLNTYEGTRVLVVGHTDSMGTDAYNQGLSQRRATAAKVYLMDLGIAGHRIDAVGRGESEPVATNETDAGRQENRRVEVAIFASEELQEEMIRRHGGGN
jgi:outer membrane protein OmpA-like peptidoglycan-associated protein